MDGNDLRVEKRKCLLRTHIVDSITYVIHIVKLFIRKNLLRRTEKRRF